MQTIRISYDGTNYQLSQSNVTDWTGCVALDNAVGDAIQIQVSTNVAGDCGYAMQSLANGASLYVPVDPTQTTTVTVTVNSSPTPSTFTVDGSAGRPKVKGTNPTWDTWEYARYIDRIYPEVERGVTETVYGLVGSSASPPTSDASGTVIDGSAMSVDPSQDDTLFLWVGSQTFGQATSSTTITLVEQGASVSVETDDDKLVALSRVLTVENSRSATPLVTVANNTDDITISVKVVEYDSPPPNDFTEIPAGQTSTFGVGSSVAYLDIEQASNSSAPRNADSDPDPNPGPNADPEGGYASLFDDPVVVIRHSGCSGNDG